MKLFVSVGNAHQPFPRLLSAVERLIEERVIDGPVLVQRGHTPYSSALFSSVDFLPMEEYQRAIKEADIVITHGGAGTILQCVQAGKRPIVLSRSSDAGEILDDHQRELIDALKAEGIIHVVEDESKLRAAIEELRSMQDRVPEVSTSSQLNTSIASLLRSIYEDGV